MALILPWNWCLIFFRDPDTAFAPAKVKELLRDSGLTVTGRKGPQLVYQGTGPTLSVSIERGSFVETMARSLVGHRRKHRTLIPGCDTLIKIILSDVEEVLDELNTLIEVQSTLQSATGGLLCTSWNHNFWGPND